MLSHEYLWTPTPIYYLAACFLFQLCKKRFELKPYTLILFMSIPITCDYLKRDYYTRGYTNDKKKLVEA